jgi:hypothetical protein
MTKRLVHPDAVIGMNVPTFEPGPLSTEVLTDVA